MFSSATGNNVCGQCWKCQIISRTRKQIIRTQNFGKNYRRTSVAGSKTLVLIRRRPFGAIILTESGLKLSLLSRSCLI